MRTGSNRAGCSSFRTGWMVRAGQADAGRAQSRCQQVRNSFPGPVRADLQGPLPGVAGEAGGDLPDPVAERIRVGVPHVRGVVVAEEAGPGGEVGGDVRGGRSTAGRPACPGGAARPGARLRDDQRRRMAGHPRRCHPGAVSPPGIRSGHEGQRSRPPGSWTHRTPKSGRPAWRSALSRSPHVTADPARRAQPAIVTQRDWYYRTCGNPAGCFAVMMLTARWERSYRSSCSERS